LLIGLVVLGLVGGVQAQETTKTDPKKHPGYVDFNVLGIQGVLGDVEAVVEISVPPPLLRMLAAAVESEDPQLAGLLSNLVLVRVQVFEQIGYDQAKKLEKVTAVASRNLLERGWINVVRVREGEDRVDILLKLKDDSIVGLVIFVVSPQGEAVLVNIVGELDPALLGRLARQFNVPQLRQLKDIKVPKDEATGRRTRRASGADSDE
jgi:hypothetical protein